MTPEELRIESFLRLGYFIDYGEERAPLDYSRVDRTAFASEPWDDLVRLGCQVLRRTFDDCWEPNRENVVPLSGGLDSRLILGALLERVQAQDLHTYTFGVPGSYDYELGNRLALKLGTRHVAMPLSQEPYNRRDILEAARRSDYQALLFHHPPMWKLDRLYSGARIWSGYLGDAVAGSYLQDPPSQTPEEAKARHLGLRGVVRSVRLHRAPDESLIPHMRDEGLPATVVSWDEQVLFAEAGAKFVAPLVLYTGYDFATPFINSPWMDFMLGIPDEFRRGQRLMIAVGLAAFPHFFGLPSRNRLGHSFATPDILIRGTFWWNRVRKLAHQFVPRVNWPNFQYSDFNEAVRTNPGLRADVLDSLGSLKKREVCAWIDIDRIWTRHDRRIRNHGDALKVLASLGLLLQARPSP